ncbi:MAG TPA: outer membrane beta-barrel protein [Allosphingosinicella sp.]|uniref:outer membrane beta-barrel protein n=1 Tax=Allosphingosinicella sp. TaxID=2823234 RepID=UPI002F27B58A
MKKFALLAVTFAAALSSPALAQEAAADTVGGFRLEAMIGYDILRAEFLEAEGRDDKGGVFGGAAVGFDFPLGAALSVGADAELTFATTDIVIPDDPAEAGPEPEGRIETKRDIYVGGRLTAHLSDSVALYGKAGYTNLRVGLDLTDDEDLDFDVAGNLDGVRGGVGVQVRGDDRAYYGFEYRYSNYEADVDRHQAMLVVGYRF